MVINKDREASSPSSSSTYISTYDADVELGPRACRACLAFVFLFLLVLFIFLVF
jgi:hypothetical protein